MTNLFFSAHVFFCTNQRPPEHELGCCKDRGGERFCNYMKRKAKELEIKDVRIQQSGCLGRCDQGPVAVVYPEGVWYSPQSEADCDEILAAHLQGGKPVERLMLKEAKS